jgi:hypothetical protein
MLRADGVRPVETAPTTSDYAYPSAKFLAQQSALTSRICSIVGQNVSRRREKAWRSYNDREASRPRDRHIQPVA